MTGFQVGGYLIVILLYNVSGPGTYPLGVGPTVTGGYAQVTDVTGGWVTPQSGEAGSVTITALTASRMTGTFEFTAPAVTGTATGTITVIIGQTDARSLTISLTDVSSPGTYTLSSAAPVRSIGVSGATSPLTSTWSSQGAGSNGTVTVSSVTASRIQGTFSATLGPAPGTQTAGNLVVTNGVFDIGRN